MHGKEGNTGFTLPPPLPHTDPLKKLRPPPSKGQILEAALFKPALWVFSTSIY